MLPEICFKTLRQRGQEGVDGVRRKQDRLSANEMCGVSAPTMGTWCTQVRYTTALTPSITSSIRKADVISPPEV